MTTLLTLAIYTSHAQTLDSTCKSIIEVEHSISELMDHIQGISSDVITYEGRHHAGSYKILHPSNFSSAYETALEVVSACPTCGFSVENNPPYAHIKEIGSLSDQLMGSEVQIPEGEYSLTEVAQMLMESWSRDFPEQRIHVGSSARISTRVRVPQGHLPTRNLLQQLEVVGPFLEPTRVVWKALEINGGVSLFLKVTRIQRAFTQTPVAERLEQIENTIADEERNIQRLSNPSGEQDQGILELFEDSLKMAEKKREDILRNCPQ